ncbi:MAG: hypothetical protein KJ000_01300 [Pirellulaceae bacterium]|nr:hypothetical protein [Pirellulaceae bacterium]
MVRGISISVLVSAVALTVGFTAVGQDAQSRIEHLSRAAAHLQQAGFADKAAEVRGLMVAEEAGELSSLLEKKLDTLAALQAEVEQLRAAIQTGSATGAEQPPQVQIRVKLLSLDPGKLENSGFPLVSLRQLLDQPEATPIVDESGKLSQFIELLQQQKLIKCIAEPTLVTIPGHEASYFSGGRLPGAMANSDEASGLEIGTRLNCLPTVEKDEIILDLDFRDSKLVSVVPAATATGASGTDSEDGGIRTGERAAPMPLGVLAVKTRIRLQSGQTVIVGGLGVKQQKLNEPARESVVILVITAEVIEPQS